MPQPQGPQVPWSSAFTPNPGGHSGLHEPKGVAVFCELRGIQPIQDQRSGLRHQR